MPLTNTQLAQFQAQAHPDTQSAQMHADAGPDALPQDATCGCILGEDGQRKQPIDCQDCACSFNGRRVCPGCYGSGMMFVACPHNEGLMDSIPTTDAISTMEGPPPGGGGGGGDSRDSQPSGSGRRRKKTVKASGKPRPAHGTAK